MQEGMGGGAGPPHQGRMGLGKQLPPSPASRPGPPAPCLAHHLPTPCSLFPHDHLPLGASSDPVRSCTPHWQDEGPGLPHTLPEGPIYSGSGSQQAPCPASLPCSPGASLMNSSPPSPLQNRSHGPTVPSRLSPCPSSAMALGDSAWLVPVFSLSTAHCSAFSAGLPGACSLGPSWVAGGSEPSPTPCGASQAGVSRRASERRRCSRPCPPGPHRAHLAARPLVAGPLRRLW